MGCTASKDASVYPGPDVPGNDLRRDGHGIAAGTGKNVRDIVGSVNKVAEGDDPSWLSANSAEIADFVLAASEKLSTLEESGVLPPEVISNCCRAIDANAPALKSALDLITNGAVAVIDALTPAAVFAAPALAAIKMLLVQVQAVRDANELRKAVGEVGQVAESSLTLSEWLFAF